MASQSQYQLVNEFRGYEHKRDVTNLPPGVLIPPSQNVRSTPGNRVGNRKGWTLDGQSDATVAGIDSSFVWNRHTGDQRPLRAGNGELQVRYVANAGDIWDGNTFTAGQVYWITIWDGLGALTNFNFVDYWDTTNVMSQLLMVHGTNNIKYWYGGFTTFASAVANTSITKQGVETWAELGFPPTGTVIINGTTYTYTGGTGTTTLTGVVGDASAEPVQSVVISGIGINTNASMSLALEKNDIIGIRGNQVYVANTNDREVYVSHVNDYTDYTFTTPLRITGEGAILTLDGNPIGFANQENAMYISAGKDQWYETKFEFLGDNGVESLSILPLKTAGQQAAQSQALMWKSPNDVMIITNEPTMSSLGRVANVVLTPQISNISDPIKIDFDSYDFTGGSGTYDRYFHYIAVPAENLWLIYNVAQKYWEPPQTGSFSGFSVIGGELYGHSSVVPETYKLDDGYNDNGAPIDCVLAMSWQNFGERAKTKKFTEVYVEGYITTNGSLTLANRYEVDGCAQELTRELDASTWTGVCAFPAEGSLGQESLGVWSLGAGQGQSSLSGLPPKFRWIPTYQPLDFFEWSPAFTSTVLDFNWEILCFGPNVTDSPSQPTNLKS